MVTQVLEGDLDGSDAGVEEVSAITGTLADRCCGLLTISSPSPWRGPYWVERLCRPIADPNSLDVAPVSGGTTNCLHEQSEQ